ncbi:MAG: class I tRNA ligase family protein, partial [bacterium]|nr:class I tRNA ligase family protein [bacterium]
FTLDTKVVRTVYDTFEKLYKDGLIYRDNYIVNFCTHCGTSFSELETEYIDRVDPLYYMKYGPFVLATVRPETKFGDTAIAVNPNDSRYEKYIGTVIEADGLNGKFSLKVIADDFVDMEFGTGVVKITPAHDPNDFQVARRHGLEVKQVIDVKGRLNSHAGQYSGLKVKEGRRQIVEELQKLDLIEKIDSNYNHRVAVCYKCKRDLEPMVLPNWFLSMKPLAKEAIDAGKLGYVKFYPERFEGEYYRWLNSIRDWPISRQTVWGIRIPAWYDIAKNPNLLVTFLSDAGVNVFGTIDELMKKYPFEEIERGLQNLTAENDSVFAISDNKPEGDGLFLPETDTFDTWFSSGQWPLVTLGYPNGEDFLKFYPTNVLDTMWDILFFWVARMIVFGIYLTKDILPPEQRVPFKNVLMHSRVVDAKGHKMSKSKGNVINPLDFTDKFGTDAFRISLVAGSALGNDVPLSEAKVKGYRNFANKIWNSARFVLDFNTDNHVGLMRFKDIYSLTIFNTSSDNFKTIVCDLNPDECSEELLLKLFEISNIVKDSIERYRFSDGAVAVYEFYWHDFCDSYIEYAKDKRESCQPILEYVLKSSMELLHPFMPFITEEIWQKLPHQEASITGV